MLARHLALAHTLRHGLDSPFRTPMRWLPINVESAAIFFRLNCVEDGVDHFRATFACVPEHPFALLCGGESAAGLGRRIRLRVKIRTREVATREESLRERFGRRP